MAKTIDATKLKEAVMLLVTETIKASKLQRVVQAQLISVSPITFKRGNDIEMPLGSLTLPYGLQFKPEDVGSTHVFIQENGWQKYTYLYRSR